MTTSRVLLHTPPSAADRPVYSLLVTTDPGHVRAAQRLRHDVFGDELGVAFDVPGHDVDRFDSFCDHLIVCDGTGAVVGTYRLLPPERATAAGGLYAEAEFDLTALAPLRPRLVEVGRSCVHPDHRTGGVIALMWAGLTRYVLFTRNRWLAGCTSVPLADGGATAAAVWRHVDERYLSAETRRVHPLIRWDPSDAPPAQRPAFPPLLRGYLRLGAQVCGAPAHDPRFGCADFFTLLDAERMNRRHLLGDVG